MANKYPHLYIVQINYPCPHPMSACLPLDFETLAQPENMRPRNAVKPLSLNTFIGAWRNRQSVQTRER